ncbi:MAG: alpha/beta hydrolase [Acetobacteraceae bacterium]|nr:alpha/beta hydrolase [Acetobacteraceae bacterium]
MLRVPCLAASALGVSLLTACSPARLLGVMQPAAPGGEVFDTAYAPGPRHAMDVYLPARDTRAPPVVVFFYGGGWRSGDKANYRFMGRSLAACGAIAILPDYRVWPDAGFDGFLADAAAAAAAAREEGRRRGGDPSRFYLMGHSAGAHIATMLALDPAWLAEDVRASVSGTIGLAGPYDFLPLTNPVQQQIFAPVGPRTQPITFAAQAKGPLLLMTGADDMTVRPANSTRLAARVRETGGHADTIVYPGVGHIGIISAFAAPFRFMAPVRADTCRFIGGVA